MAMPFSTSGSGSDSGPAPRRRRASRSGRWPHPSTEPGLVSRPLLVAALRPVWRGQHTLQLGIDPARAVVLDQVDERLARLVLGLDGTRTEAQVLADGAAARIDPRFLASLLASLRAAGAVTDGWPTSAPASGQAADEQALGLGRLAPDVASFALLPPPGTPAQKLHRRQAASVVVHGAGRIGATVATLLAAAGVGNIHVVDRGSVNPADPAPAGLAVGDIDRPKAVAIVDAIRRSAPEVRTGRPAPDQPPNLVVLADGRPADVDLLAALHASRLPHLAVGIRETTAIVGPLVRPGTTSCLRCADLHRTERDPAWPLVAAQLANLRRRSNEPCDIVLATLAGTVAVLQCLSHLDGVVPATAGATLELALPDWRLRRRTWLPHPRCGCLAATDPCSPGPAKWRQVG